MTDSIISGNKTIDLLRYSYGGGIYKCGTLTVQNSIISNNSASGDRNGQGGGIDNEGKLTVVHSTFLKNTPASW